MTEVHTKKITAYTLYDQAIAIEPAPNDGTWSREIVADLALSSASSKGWILLCPYVLEATWNGGSSPEDIDIRIEAPDDETYAKAVLGLGAQGSVSTETLKAFTEDEYRRIIGSL